MCLIPHRRHIASACWGAPLFKIKPAFYCPSPHAEERIALRHRQGTRLEQGVSLTVNVTASALDTTFGHHMASVTITWLQNDMLVSQRMARETNITNRVTGWTLKQHIGTLHKKARKWMDKTFFHIKQGLEARGSQEFRNVNCLQATSAGTPHLSLKAGKFRWTFR